MNFEEKEKFASNTFTDSGETEMVLFKFRSLVSKRENDPLYLYLHLNYTTPPDFMVMHHSLFP